MNEEQYGLRKNRSTVDCLIILESKIQEAFSQKEYLIVVSFYLGKACNTAWLCNVLRNIFRLSIKGNMFFFIQNFMANRTFSVQIRDTTSEKYNQENGVVQGAVLSVKLFLLVSVMDITSALRDPVTITGYAVTPMTGKFLRDTSTSSL
jgi:hypothetical protein